MTRPFESKRAKFLKGILDAYESHDNNAMWEVTNNAWLDFWPTLWWLGKNEEFNEKDQAILQHLGKELMLYMGRINAAERMSLSPSVSGDHINKIWKDSLHQLSPRAKDALPDVLELMEFGKLDTIDARFAQEIVERLRKIVNRIGLLDALPQLDISNRSVQLAFEEAHRCYLYGFRTACAALCRATVESSVLDALAKTRHDRFPDDTNLAGILNLSPARSLLGDLHTFAHEIRDAGNDAVHDLAAFEKKYPADRVQDVLLKTRMIIERLYANSDGLKTE
jgi:hypothetical protein